MDNLEILSRQKHIEKDHGKPVIGISETLNHVIYKSIASAMRHQNNKGISSAINKNYIFGGYYWYYLDFFKSKMEENGIEFLITYNDD